MEQGLIIKQDRSLGTVKWELGEALKPLQNVVDGYIEAIDLGDGLTMMVNEDGLFRGDLEHNKLASVLILRWLGIPVVIRGDVVVLRYNDEDEGKASGLSVEDIDNILKPLEGWVRK